jgi:predicted dehydrogenase
VKPVIVGVIGSGYMAREYLSACNYVSGIKIDAIFSTNHSTASLLAQDYKISHLCNSLVDLMSVNEIQAVIVCVPESETEKILEICANYPVVVLVEKPAGLNLESASRIVHFFEKSNNCFVALNRRFYSSSIHLLDSLKLEKGTRFISIVDQEDLIAAEFAGQPREVLDSWHFANAIHIIDFIVLLARGDVVEFKRSRFELDSSAYVITTSIFFDSGDVVEYKCFWNTPARWSVEVNLGKKQFRLKPLESVSEIELGQRQHVAINLDEDDSLAKPGLIKMLRGLESQVITGKSELVSVQRAFETMKMIGMIYE